MSTLKTHNLQSPDAGSVNVALAPNAGMVVSGISTFNNKVLIGTATEGYSSADDLTVSTSGTTGITIRSGTSNTGTLAFSDGTSGADEYRGYIQYQHQNDALAFGSHGTERFRITSGGDMGLGTNSPASSHDRVLTIAGTNSAELKLTGSNYGVTDTDGADVLFSYGGLYLINNESTGNIHFHTGSGIPERLRIASNGGIGIATDKIPRNYFLHIAAPSQDYTNTSTQLTDGGGIMFQHTDTLASTGRTYPGIFWSGNTSALGRARAGIIGVTASNNDATHIAFLTRIAANGTSFYPSDERMRITSDGKLLLGRTTLSHTSSTMEIQGTSEAYLRISPNTNTGTAGVVFGTADDHSTGGIYFNGSDDSLVLAGHNNDERMRIDSSGRVIIGATNTTNASANADDLVISGSGNRGITIVSTNSDHSNIYFSDGTGAYHYVGYCQYDHGNNRLNLGAGGAQRGVFYDKDGANGTTKAVLQVGGSVGSNHYNSYSGGASLTFGGGNDIDNYFIGTRMENIGGNYTKLDLRWHTGIRMGAQQNYGGIRFYESEDLNTVKFSVMYQGDYIQAFTTFRPGANNTYNCGTSGRRWAQIWYYNANTTSDRNEKNTITESDLGLDFICKLKPVSYKWNQREGENADTKTHYGLISQDVEEAVIESGKTLDDFGAIVKPEGDDPMGLSYNEFISPLVKAIQEQQEQIKILQEKIASLEGS